MWWPIGRGLRANPRSERWWRTGRPPARRSSRALPAPSPRRGRGTVALRRRACCRAAFSGHCVRHARLSDAPGLRWSLPPGTAASVTEVARSPRGRWRHDTATPPSCPPSCGSAPRVALLVDRLAAPPLPLPSAGSHPWPALPTAGPGGHVASRLLLPCGAFARQPGLLAAAMLNPPPLATGPCPHLCIGRWPQQRSTSFEKTMS